MSTEEVEVLEGVTDQELFNDANSDEPIADEVTEVAEEAVEQEQPRDEAGRFAEKPADEPEKPVATDTPAIPPVDDNAAMVPSWRVREINEEKRALAEKVAAFEAERLQWQRQPASQPQPEVKAEKPDPLLDPEGYEKFLENKFEEKLLNDRRETSLANAHKTYKTEFDEAYTAAQQAMARGDQVIAVRMRTSRDPGETLIEWHREQKTRAEVGNDPNAYFEKKLDAWLADPANQAKVIERARGTAQQQPGTTRQSPAVSLPPSLTRATAASAEISADDDDISNDALWRHANA